MSNELRAASLEEEQACVAEEWHPSRSGGVSEQSERVCFTRHFSPGSKGHHGESSMSAALCESAGFSLAVMHVVVQVYDIVMWRRDVVALCGYVM